MQNQNPWYHFNFENFHCFKIRLGFAMQQGPALEVNTGMQSKLTADVAPPMDLLLGLLSASAQCTQRNPERDSEIQQLVTAASPREERVDPLPLWPTCPRVPGPSSDRGCWLQPRQTPSSTAQQTFAARQPPNAYLLPGLLLEHAFCRLGHGHLAG